MKPTERSAKPASTPKTALFATLCALAALALPGVAQAGSCPNEPLRTGPSASLPDCRAYELITPENLGRGQDMTFTGEDRATPSSDGEHLGLASSAVELEPNSGTSPTVAGTRAVFSRTSQGWVMKSVVDPGSQSVTSADNLDLELSSPDLSQVALHTYTFLNLVERSPDKAFEVGPVGGPYTVVANVPLKEATGSPTKADFVGANAGTASVPSFSDVLLESSDHGLAFSAAERGVAEGTIAETEDVYDWSGGQLRLVNVTSEGALTSPCGAVLGDGVPALGPGAINAVSADGSKIFFMSPEPSAIEQHPASCPEPSRLYMRVDGRETVEVSKPQGVTVLPSERKKAEYIGATPDGSRVFFTTITRLTKETAEEEAKEAENTKMGREELNNKLFMFDTVTGKLTLIAFGVKGKNNGNRKFFVISGDGSTVYYQTPPSSNVTENIYR
ncbi:MAG TPA: hypothetical protein VKA15_10365, partial [Isosphaeraceae bacterium]|nr:hypothetical protein [Isosphaeraceae bacterium]